jgi:ribA/ribD-fused uncharacterized protein
MGIEVFKTFKTFFMATISFTKVDLPYGWLGNMAPYRITHEEKLWLTAEALFQSMRFADPDIQELIRKEKSPMGAKMRARAHRDQIIIKPMSDQDVQNMRTCLDLKFRRHEELKKALIKTAPHIIIEDIGSRNGERHKFWGAKRTFNGEWEGTNMMGQLLMELRSKLIAEKA